MLSKASYPRVALFTSLLVLAATALQVGADYFEVQGSREVMVDDITRVVASHMEATVTQAQNVMQLVAAMVQDDGGVDRMGSAARWQVMQAYCASLMGCRTLAVVDPNGQLVSRSDAYGAPVLDASYREYFTVPARTRRSFVGPAVVSRLPGSAILFSVSSPVVSRDGELLGVVSVGLDTDHATKFYGLMGFGFHPTVTIFKGNGDVVARNPDMAGQVGKNNAKGPLFTEHLPRAPQGAYESVSVLDGKRRLAAYRSLPHLDLVIFAGIEREVALAPWIRRTVRTAVISTCMLLLINLTLYAGYWSAKQRLRVQARNDELTVLAELDGLTGIPNRRAFDLALQAAGRQRDELGSPLSVVLVDVDHFKAYNDRYGHPQGDACLRAVAHALQSCALRDGDVVARYGGEEFAAVLPCGLEGAERVAERMRESVTALLLPHADAAALWVSVSVGVASAEGPGPLQLDRLVAEADAALYAAKQQGRNRVCLAPAETTDPQALPRHS